MGSLSDLVFVGKVILVALFKLSNLVSIRYLSLYMTTGMKKSQHGNKVYNAFDPTPYIGNGVTRNEVL